ncbi:hypothetical protein L596_015574 [Steinernema carpocapsae]|uniref:Uncharacterized protein n=1 Tax=Steinernema carpocapsae TaxID=34508 RepID=A0A4U5NGE1_STECR|nr:hypothetical protein L596_015574 [Steinernema carpocapsae]
MSTFAASENIRKPKALKFEEAKSNMCYHKLQALATQTTKFWITHQLKCKEFDAQKNEECNCTGRPIHHKPSKMGPKNGVRELVSLRDRSTTQSKNGLIDFLFSVACTYNAISDTKNHKLSFNPNGLQVAESRVRIRLPFHRRTFDLGENKQRNDCNQV